MRIDKRHLLGHKIHVSIIFKVFVELDNVRVVLMQTKDADESKCIKLRNYYCEKDGDTQSKEKEQYISKSHRICHTA